jgi:hypothetical protein
MSGIILTKPPHQFIFNFIFKNTLFDFFIDYKQLLVVVVVVRLLVVHIYIFVYIHFLFIM